MTSVIVPVHNEAAVIERCLRALLNEVEPDDEIIVVCNGCTDDSEAIARRFEPRITVKVASRASKALALNLGDTAATQFPRVYLDADVVVGHGTLSRLTAALTGGRYLAAAPVPRMDFQRSTWPVRAYYRVWLSMPYCQAGLLGAGVYALSEAGRARFSDFPDLISDDGFVRANFREDERGSVSDAYVTVSAPARLRWLLKIKTRSRAGQFELKQRFPDLIANERKDYGSGVRTMLRNPDNWLPAMVYLYVVLITRWQASRMLGAHENIGWEKDHSSRGIS